MELRLFSCLSFLWPERNTKSDGAASPLDSCSRDLSPLLRRINDPCELRRVLHCLGADGNTDLGVQISLSRLFLPFRLHRLNHATTDEVNHDRDEDASDRDEDDEGLVTIEDALAAVTEADSLACVGSLISAFDFYDRDGDGVISAADLLLALRDVVGGEAESEVPSATACEAIVAAFDREGVGGVSFGDFIRMMMGPDMKSSSGHRKDEKGALHPFHPSEPAT